MLVSELILPDTLKAFDKTAKNLSKYYFYADNAIEQTALTLFKPLFEHYTSSTVSPTLQLIDTKHL